MFSDWKNYKLKDLITIKHGYAFKGNYISTKDNGVVLVTPGNFAIGGGFQETKCKFYTSDYPEDYILKENDLIVTMTDLSKEGDTLGYSAKIPKSRRIYLHNQRIGLVEIQSSEIDKEFLYWYMRTKNYQKSIVNSCSGSVIKHTSPGRICDLEILLPPIKTQQKIAKVLNAIDDKIELNNKINENLEQQALAIFKSWFVNFEPFDRTMPADWKIGTLGDIADICSGKRPLQKENCQTTEFCIPILGASSVMGYTNKHLYNDKILITGRVGTHGIIQKVSYPCWASDNTLVITSKYYEFTYQILKTIDYNNLNRGSTQPLITQTDLKNVKITIPNAVVLNQFEVDIDRLMRLKQNLLNENKVLTHLRDTLLTKLMNCKIDVSNIDTCVNHLSFDKN